MTKINLRQTIAMLKVAFSLFAVAWSLLCICFRRTFVERLKSDGFFTAPASTKYHGAYEGGLFEHSLNVTNSLVELTKQNSLTWGRPESPYIIGMFHDICKQDQYRHPVDATFYGGGAPIPLVDEASGSTTPMRFSKGTGRSR